MKVPPPIRRHEFRYAKCARQTFLGGGVSAAGRMEVYYVFPLFQVFLYLTTGDTFQLILTIPKCSLYISIAFFIQSFIQFNFFL